MWCFCLCQCRRYLIDRNARYLKNRTKIKFRIHASDCANISIRLFNCIHSIDCCTLVRCWITRRDIFIEPFFCWSCQYRSLVAFRCQIQLIYKAVSSLKTILVHLSQILTKKYFSKLFTFRNVHLDQYYSSIFDKWNSWKNRFDLHKIYLSRWWRLVDTY